MTDLPKGKSQSDRKQEQKERGIIQLDRCGNINYNLYSTMRMRERQNKANGRQSGT